MASNDAELIRKMINVVTQTNTVPSKPLMENQEVDEAITTGYWQRLGKFAASFMPGGGGKEQRLVQKLGYQYALAWQSFMKRQSGGLSYADVTWKYLRMFVLSPGPAGRLTVPGTDSTGTPLTATELQGIVADPRFRKAVDKAIVAAGVQDPRYAPLSKLLPANGNISSLLNTPIGGPIAGGADKTAQDARAKRAEIICMTILESAAVVMFNKAEGIHDPGEPTPAGGRGTSAPGVPAPTPAAGAGGAPAGTPALTADEITTIKQLLGL